MLLSLRQVEAGYGPAKVLHGISLDVGEGEVVCLLGGNGAGKSTTLMTILGLLRPRAGTIEFRGSPIGGRATVDIVRSGVAIVPEGRRIFGSLTVEENLQIGAAIRGHGRADPRAIDAVMGMFPEIQDRMQQLAGTMSGGQQQMLAIARALVTQPRLVLMDEPSMGLSPVLGERVFEIIERIRAQGVSVLLVEQNAYATLGVASRGYVLQSGEIVLEGSADALRDSPLVRQAYL
ncbi:ABC transporter ATP-binding protein [Verticiella sediminum]|uniref:ABC transporter ATP-binding protein n=1 Tax=Verticiella sediminum TaxID=1247510 RepID=A0A556ACH9_9BURK|nr:ABC transporter ATP-binding protein [Verticiella sediminum]TSH90573.1 ABC transporter ATP-binding protein [Verticiella sediminum]